MLLWRLHRQECLCYFGGYTDRNVCATLAATQTGMSVLLWRTQTGMSVLLWRTQTRMSVLLWAGCPGYRIWGNRTFSGDWRMEPSVGDIVFPSSRPPIIIGALLSPVRKSVLYSFPVNFVLSGRRDNPLAAVVSTSYPPNRPKPGRFMEDTNTIHAVSVIVGRDRRIGRRSEVNPGYPSNRPQTR